MARNLLEARHTVEVFDLSAEATAPLAERGASVADSALAAATDKDYVISMLPAGKHVSAVYLGDEGLLAQLDADERAALSPLVPRA
jgi:3-hydroxyisobutyrate dehydrogenase